MFAAKLLAIVLALPALVTLVPVCSATTIDFETPDLGGTAWQVIDPYVAGGVVFTAAAPIGLVRECDLVITRATPCGSCTNQLLGSSVTPDCPIGVYDAPLKATFLPEAGAVLSVTLTVQTLSYSTVYLRLYDASDVLVGSGEASVVLAYENCGDPNEGEMTSRGVVHADASVSIAYVEVFVLAGWQCPGVPGCYACNPFAVDDFTFGTEAVPASPASWSRIKALYWR